MNGLDCPAPAPCASTSTAPSFGPSAAYSAALIGSPSVSISKVCGLIGMRLSL